MSQIVNINEIKKALKGGKELHGKLMSQCCCRALEHDKRCLREVTEYPDPARTPHEGANSSGANHFTSSSCTRKRKRSWGGSVGG